MSNTAEIINFPHRIEQPGGRMPVLVKHMLPMKHIPQRFLYSVKKIWLNLPLLLPP